MSLGPWIGLLVIIGALLRLVANADGSPKRLRGLRRNGAAAGAFRVVIAASWVNRRVGLLNHASLPPDTGLWLWKVKSVHTVGMLFPIDVVYLDREGRVLALHEAAAPGTAVARGPRGTRDALELPAGSAKGLGIKAGDVMKVEG